MQVLQKQRTFPVQELVGPAFQPDDLQQLPRPAAFLLLGPGGQVSQLQLHSAQLAPMALRVLLLDHLRTPIITLRMMLMAYVYGNATYNHIDYLQRNLYPSSHEYYEAQCKTWHCAVYLTRILWLQLSRI